MQLTQPVCRHPVSSATNHTRARPRLRRAAAAPSWRAHSGPWRAGTRQPAPSALRPDALRAAGHTARQRKSSTHMYVGFSVLAAGAKLPSISAPQLPAAGRQEEGWTRSLEVGRGVRFARKTGSLKDGTRPRGCPDRCEANDAEPSERASARAQHKCARVHVGPAIGCHGSGSRHRGARRRLSRRVQVAAGASQRRARAGECRRGHVAGTTGRGKVVRNRARAGTRKKRTTR